ncbi:MAG: putative enzyme related to lactoylglutathione lyase [Acidimicrobiales bacterium]|jgi:PhnB protein|nr:putative enzyme related to lactoylglutathione lyase [Acidimicrobiales bacterium]
MAAVKPIPDDYPKVMAYLAIDGAAGAIDFYKTIFGAVERVRMDQPDGRVGHAELQFGDSVVMLADTFPDMGHVDPKQLGGTPVAMTIYVDDVDATFAAAIDAGATETQPVEDKFYGDWAGQFDDPWGHRWNVMTHVEDVSPEEMQKRIAALDAG